MAWESVIGLEVHVQLATQSKIFSGSATTFGAEPNTQACAIDLAMPGTLPVANDNSGAPASKTFASASLVCFLARSAEGQGNTLASKLDKSAATPTMASAPTCNDLRRVSCVDALLRCALVVSSSPSIAD